MVNLISLGKGKEVVVARFNSDIKGYQYSNSALNNFVKLLLIRNKFRQGEGQLALMIKSEIKFLPEQKAYYIFSDFTIDGNYYQTAVFLNEKMTQLTSGVEIYELAFNKGNELFYVWANGGTRVAVEEIVNSPKVKSCRGKNLDGKSCNSGINSHLKAPRLFPNELQLVD